MLDYEVLMEGIQKQPECTTMSPSGCHLGIYKTLRKHIVGKKKNTTNDIPPNDKATGTLTQGWDILYLIFDLMSLVLTHAYPLKQW